MRYALAFGLVGLILIAGGSAVGVGAVLIVVGGILLLASRTRKTS